MEDEKDGDISKAVLLQRRPSKPLQNVDDLFIKLGKPGRFQVLLFFLLAVNLITVSSNALAGVFFEYRPTHICNSSVDSTDYESWDQTESPNVIHSDVKPHASLNSTPGSSNSSIDVEIISQTECSVRFKLDGLKNISKSCHSGEWIYDVSGRESSTVTEFDLVCDKTFLASLASTLYYIGVMLAGFLWGYLSDLLGRRLVVMVTVCASLAVGLGIAFSENIATFMVFRVLMGFFVQGLQTASYILAMELFPVRYRGHAGAGFQMFWGVGVLYLSGVAWLVQDWRHIQLCLLGPVAVGAVSIWFIPESLRWLLSTGKTHRAGLVVDKITRFNNLPNPVRDEDKLLAEYKVHYIKSHASYLSLIRTKEMRKRVLCSSFIWFGNNIGYYFLSYKSNALAGNRYLNFFVGGIAESICAGIVAYSIVRFGRRKPLMTLFIIGSLLCITVGVIPRDEDENPSGTKSILITVFSLLGRLCFSGLYAGADVFSAELFPTVVRNMGMGVCVFLGRTGAGLAPQIYLLGQCTFSQLPPLLIAGVGLTGAFMVFILSETKGKHLPDTVQDVQDVETNFGKPIIESGEVMTEFSGNKDVSSIGDVNGRLTEKMVTFEDNKSDEIGQL